MNLRNKMDFVGTRAPEVLVLSLCLIAVTLPITAAYFSVFLYVLVSSLTPKKSNLSAEIAIKKYQSIAKPVHLGVLCMTLLHLLAAIIAYCVNDRKDISLAQVFVPIGHLILKWCVLWFCIYFCIKRSLARGAQLFKAFQIVLVWMTIYAIYCICQRVTGIDIVHGFGARLGVNRYAYGVYRISGFMGHPLSLGYNLLLLSIASFLFSIHSFLKRDQRSFILTGALSTLILGISGSRYPFFILLALLLFLIFKSSLRVKKIFVLLLAAVPFFLIYENSIIARIRELFDQKLNILERFDRVVFWMAHWRVFEKYPIAGSGSWLIDSELIAQYQALNQTTRMYNAHNIFLQHMAEGGLISLTGFVGFIWSLFLASKQADKISKSGQEIAFMSCVLVLTGLLQNNFRDSEFIYAFWLILALVIARISLSEDEAIHY